MGGPASALKNEHTRSDRRGHHAKRLEIASPLAVKRRHALANRSYPSSATREGSTGRVSRIPPERLPVESGSATRRGPRRFSQDFGPGPGSGMDPTNRPHALAARPRARNIAARGPGPSARTCGQPSGLYDSFGRIRLVEFTAAPPITCSFSDTVPALCRNAAPQCLIRAREVYFHFENSKFDQWLTPP